MHAYNYARLQLCKHTIMNAYIMHAYYNARI